MIIYQQQKKGSSFRITGRGACITGRGACVSKAHIKDSMYVKRKFQSFCPIGEACRISDLSKFVERNRFPLLHERSVKSFRKVEKWLKLAMRLFPKSERIFHMKVSCQYGFVIDNNNESDLFKWQWLTNFGWSALVFFCKSWKIIVFLRLVAKVVNDTAERAIRPMTKHNSNFWTKNEKVLQQNLQVQIYRFLLLFTNKLFPIHFLRWLKTSPGPQKTTLPAAWFLFSQIINN
jgi:hypothetical protein